ncbi:hypothetical protein JTB14_011924 [Gonioctena quinquepunctata]|nr:hypothetical protein JTB14_011924 [Gonioctena quinquepunctata]
MLSTIPKQTLRNDVRMSRVYVSDNYRKWDENLSKVACATRTAVHETTSATPFYIHFGRNMILHCGDFGKYELTEDQGSKDRTHMDNEDREIGFKKLFSDVGEKLRKAAQMNLKTYNPESTCVEKELLHLQ